MLLKLRKPIIVFFILLSGLSVYFATQLKFSFSFDQFFPKGDPDLEFYKNFAKEFESDDNFLMIAVENKPSIFDSSFLARFHKLTLSIKDAPHITRVQSLTTLSAPVKTPFGITAIPMIHMDNPEYYESDSTNLVNDERLVYTLIDSNATSLVIACKTKADLGMDESRELTDKVDELLASHGLTENSYILGRAYFQRELIDFQKKEMLMAFITSIILVTFIMFLIYRKPIGIAISLGSIALGLLLFMGYLGATGTELNAVSALFPVIMLIVGSSDVIHIFSKYVDELNKGNTKQLAMEITVMEIGLATFMTSATTAIGFASLYFSKLKTIQDFGINAAIGVMIAYVTVILLTTVVLSLFDKNQIISEQYQNSKWTPWLEKIFNINRYHQKTILITVLALLIIFGVGISKISTNYNIEDNLPRGSKVTRDFLFFEKHYAGFRPLEFAIASKTNEQADDFLVLKEVDKIEQKAKSTGVIKSSMSLATLYRSINKMNNANAQEAYLFPEDEDAFYAAQKLVERGLKDEANILVSKDRLKTRISARISDIGADKIKAVGTELDDWINKNIDTSLISVKRTGTGLILDKNSEYVTKSLLQGLGFSVLIISMLMALLFKSLRMLIIALIPNIIPLLFAAAIIGFFGIELEAGVAIMFSIIFGIAVDDSIHFLSRYNLCLKEGLAKEKAIHTTIHESGKAIIFTTIVMFFGFFMMIFSVNPPTFTVGVLIAVTLVSALICDLLLLPALILRFTK